MNQNERQDWLKAAAECLPAWKLAPLLETLARLDAAGAPGFWEGAVSGRLSGQALGLRYFGGEQDYGAWRRACGAALGLSAPDGLRAPGAGYPWLDLTWDAAQGALKRASFLSRAPGGRARALIHEGAAAPRQAVLTPGRFAPACLGDPGLAKVLAEFALHCPVRDLLFEVPAEGAAGLAAGAPWSLRLKRPVPWPLFLRLDLAAPFSADASQLSLLVLNHGVSELAFQGEELWACFRG